MVLVLERHLQAQHDVIRVLRLEEAGSGPIGSHRSRTIFGRVCKHRKREVSGWSLRLCTRPRDEYREKK